MKFFKRFCILFLLFVAYLLVSAFSYSNAVSSDLSNNVFRLHILANSDSEEDQNLKLIVRDNILEYMKSISENASSKQEIIDLMQENLNNFYDIAKNTIENEGFDYDVNLEIGEFDFPTKVYGDISLPAGNYDALRIEIGEAKGHNWWCVMFPTLCFVDVSNGSLDKNSKDILESNLNEEEFELISENSPIISLKFKVVEFFENMKISLASK